MIRMHKICKDYTFGEAKTRVLHDINLAVKSGEFVAIMGPSGSGKSTLLNLLGLLDSPTSGEYYLDGVNMNRLRSDELAKTRNQVIGFIFQSYMLLPQLTLIENVALPLTYHSVPYKHRMNKSKEMLTRIGLQNLIQKRPTEISGGQQQRVAIARALIMNPKLVLADEPTGALDSSTGQEIFNLLKEFNETQKTTVIIITHDINYGKQCDRRLTLKDGKMEE